jgi:hypothetical protein
MAPLVLQFTPSHMVLEEVQHVPMPAEQDVAAVALSQPFVSAAHASVAL